MFALILYIYGKLFTKKGICIFYSLKFKVIARRIIKCDYQYFYTLLNLFIVHSLSDIHNKLVERVVFEKDLINIGVLLIFILI